MRLRVRIKAVISFSVTIISIVVAAVTRISAIYRWLLYIPRTKNLHALFNSFNSYILLIWGFPGGASGKEPACQSRRYKRRGVWFPGWEDPLEKGTAIHSNILIWGIPWTEEPGRLQSMGSQRVGHNWSNLAHMHTFLILFHFHINNNSKTTNAQKC